MTDQIITHFNDIIKSMEDKQKQKFNSASEFKQLPFLNDTTKLSYDKMQHLSKTTTRAESIDKINRHVCDVDAAVEIEAGVFEFTILYSTMKNLMDNLLSAVYMDKLHDIISNLKRENSHLKKIINTKKIPFQKLAFLSPQEIEPNNWDELKRKQELQEYKKKNMGATDLYQCKNCGHRKTQVTQMQTRSADEKMTLFITCMVCYTTFKKWGFFLFSCFMFPVSCR